MRFIRTVMFIIALASSQWGFAQNIASVAGTGGSAPVGDGGMATAAGIGTTGKILFDANGNMYISAGSQHRLRRINAITGVISTIAGTGIAGISGDGSAAGSAQINEAFFSAIDHSGNIYLSDSGNRRIRKIDALSGLISTLAGNGAALYSGDGGLASLATLRGPSGIAVDAGQNIFVADSNRVRRIDGVTGTITLFAGSFAGFAGDGGPATAAAFNDIRGLCIDAAGNLLVADFGNNRVRRIDGAGIVSTIAGDGSAAFSSDGVQATMAGITPHDIAVDAAGHLYIADVGNNRVRRVAPSGLITTIAGTGTAGYSGDGGPATSAAMSSPGYVAVGVCDQNLYIGDIGNGRIRKVAFTALPVACGCFPTVNVMAAPGDTICSGEQVTFTASVLAGGATTTYQWFVNGSAVSGTGNTLTFFPADKDSVRCVVTTSGGTCVSSVSVSGSAVNMVVHPSPDAGTVSGPPGICIGASVPMAATIPGGAWTSANSSVATINAASGIAQSLALGTTVITYTMGPDVNGCTAQTTFTLNVIASSFTMVGAVADAACYGDSTASVTLTADPSGSSYTYNWSYGGTLATATGIPAGTYSVLVTDTATKCKRSASFTVVEPDSLHAEIFSEKRVCHNGGFLRADVTGGTSPYRYMWVSHQDSVSGMEVSPRWGGVYTLTVTDTNGCTWQRWENFIDVPCNTVFVGEGFSPNGDGFNDVWSISGLDEYPANSVYVFDKWGDVVFEKTGYRNDWNGTKGDGAHLPDGVYYYLVKLNEPSKTGGDNVFKGAVMIKR